jgi:hypothetical protein
MECLTYPFTLALNCGSIQIYDISEYFRRIYSDFSFSYKEVILKWLMNPYGPKIHRN